MSDSDLKEKEEADILNDTAADLSPEEQAEFGSLADNDDAAENKIPFNQEIRKKGKKFLSKKSTKLLLFGGGGAGLLFEIALVGKPAIIIPLSQGSRGDQIVNAAEFAKYGGSVLEEGNLTIHILMNQLESLLRSESYSAVSEKIRSFAKPDAADKIADILLS